MLSLATRLKLPVLDYDPDDDSIGRLTDSYFNMKIIPKAKREDALHVAIATICEMDIIVTWNYRHLAGLERETAIARANFLEGFTKPLRLITPLELAYP